MEIVNNLDDPKRFKTITMPRNLKNL